MFHVRGNCLNAAGSDWFFFFIWLKVKGIDTKCWLSLWATLTTKFYILTIFYSDHFKLFHDIFETLTFRKLLFFFQTQLQPPATPAQTENVGLKTCDFSPSVSFPIIFGTLSFSVAIFYGKRTVTTTSNFSKTFSQLLPFSNLFFNLSQLLPEQTMLVWKHVIFLIFS